MDTTFALVGHGPDVADGVHGCRVDVCRCRIVDGDIETVPSFPKSTSCVHGVDAAFGRPTDSPRDRPEVPVLDRSRTAGVCVRLAFRAVATPKPTEPPVRV